MSYHTSPRIVTDNLMMYIDTGNSKSYKGKPATNILTYTDFSASWSGYCGNTSNVTTNTTAVAAPDGSFTATRIVRGTSSTCTGADPSMGLLYYNGSNVFTAGQTYTASIWARCDTGTMTLILGLNDGHSAGITINDRWSRISVTATASSPLDRGLQFLTNDTSGRTFYVWGPQTELGSYATQYVPSGATNGVRTVTNGLLDLTGNNTINLTNAGFDSSANLTFNGSSNYLNCGTGINLQQNFTLECWAYITGDSSGLFGQGTFVGSQGLHILWNAYNNRGMVFGMYGNDLDTPGYNLTFNTWHHFAFTYNHSTFLKQFYADGVLINSGAGGAYAGSGQFNVGATYSSGGAPAKGKIASAKVYSRVLSATEIAQNYNATKGRFGL